MAEASVRVVFTGSSGSATSAAKRVEGSFLSLGRVLRTVAGVAVGVAIVRGLKAAGKAALDFDASMRNVNSIAKLSEKQFQALQRSVLALAGPTGKAPKDLADGLYDIVSSGFQAADAMKVLKAGAVAATAGQTDTATATKALVAVLNAYHLSADKAGEVSDTLFDVVNLGVLSFEELAGSVGDFAPQANALGIPLREVGAALATLTLQGGSAAERTTQLSRLMTGLAKPTDAMQELIKKWGFETGEAAIEALGFTEVLRRIDKDAGGSQKRLNELFAEIRGVRAATSLSGKGLEDYQRVLDGVGMRAGSAAAAFKEQSKSLAVQWDKAKAAITAAAIPIAQILFPALVKGAQALADFAGKVSSVLPQIKAGFSGFLDPIKSAFDGLMDIGSRVGEAFRGLLDIFGGAGKGLAGMFKDAETAGRTLGQGLVVLVGGLLAYKAAINAAKIATIAWEAVTTKSVVGLLLKAGIFIGGAVASWFGLKSAMDSAAQSATQFVYPFERAKQAVESLNQTLSAALPTAVQLRNSNLQLQQAELNVAQAIAYRNQVAQTAGKNSLEYAQAQLQVKQAYAALDDAERNRALSLDNVRTSVRATREADKAFIQTLFEQNAVLADASPAFQRVSIMAGGLRSGLSGFAAAAREGTDKMRRWTAAILALGEELGRMPTRKEVEVALQDEKFRPKLLRALRDLDLLSAKDVRTKVDIKVIAKDALEDVNRKLDEAKRKHAEPKVILQLKNAKADLKKLLEDLSTADGAKAQPKINLLKGKLFQILEDATAAIEDLDGEKAQPSIDLQGWQEALAHGASVESMLGRLNGKTATTKITTIRETKYTTVGRPGGASGGFAGGDIGGELIHRAVGGFIPGPWNDMAPDSVPAMLKPGELVLNRPQQNVLGGPGFLARLFGFTPPAGGADGVQHFAEGSFVSAAGAGSRLQGIIKKDKKNSGYKAKSKAVETLKRRLESNRDRQDRLARSISQDAREFDISVEEFIKVDADGNETLDTAAVQKRIGEIDALIGRYNNELIPAIDEETAILAALIEALAAAIAAWKAEIKDQERVIRETTALIRDATKKMNDATDDGVKAEYQKVIDKAERTRDNARSKISDLRGEISTAQDDKRGYGRERRDQPLDKRDAQLDVQELQAERAEVAATKARPPEPTSSEAESAAADAGADGFSSAPEPAAAGEAGTSAADQALIDALRRQVAQLKLALGIEGVQLPIIGAYQLGTLHVPQTGLALVHAGERITPAGVAGAVRGGDGGTVSGHVVVELLMDDRLDRLVDARVRSQTGSVIVKLGREADRIARSGEAGGLSAPNRRL